MNKIAVLLTVHNRKEVTLKGLQSLYKAIGFLKNLYPEKDYYFDIYMTDDGCTDGTGNAVKNIFPEVNILLGDGNLFWGGGMRMAWESALRNSSDYKFILWFNDDSELYENALVELFRNATDHNIVVGAFCDENGKTSYGGRDLNDRLIHPNGKQQSVQYMNGNLVLIPKAITDKIGIIDKRLRHGGGDFEYSMRSKKSGFDVILSCSYVGKCNRHDELIPPYCLESYNLRKRIEILNSPKYNPQIHFYFNKMRYGYIRACFNFAISYLGAVCPLVYNFIKNNIKY